MLVLLLKLALLELFPDVTPLIIDDPRALLLLLVVPIEDLILRTLGACVYIVLEISLPNERVATAMALVVVILC